MPKHDPHHVFAAEASLLAEDLLDSLVVLAVEEPQPILQDEPAGERPGGLADVGLREVSPLPGITAEAILPHQQSGVMLGGLRLAVGTAVGRDQHGRVGRDGQQHRLQLAQGMGPQQMHVIAHRADIFDIGVGHGKMVVPEQRHLLQQRVRTADRPTQPPGTQRLHGTAIGVKTVVRPIEFGHVRSGTHQPIDRLLRTVGQGFLELTPVTTERGPTVEMPGQWQVPGTIGVRIVASPGPLGIGKLLGGNLSRR